MTVPHIAFAGYSGSGKTTLAVRVVRRLKDEGLKIGTLKHDAHAIELDPEGKDTYQLAEAGADIVVIASGTKLFRIERLDAPPAPADLLDAMTGVDLVIVEGYKREQLPKILVAQTVEQLELLRELTGVVAIAASLELLPYARSLKDAPADTTAAAPEAQRKAASQNAVFPMHAAASQQPIVHADDTASSVPAFPVDSTASSVPAFPVDRAAAPVPVFHIDDVEGITAFIKKFTNLS